MSEGKLFARRALGTGFTALMLIALIASVSFGAQSAHAETLVVGSEALAPQDAAAAGSFVRGGETIASATGITLGMSYTSEMMMVKDDDEDADEDDVMGFSGYFKLEISEPGRLTLDATVSSRDADPRIELLEGTSRESVARWYADDFPTSVYLASGAYYLFFYDYEEYVYELSFKTDFASSYESFPDAQGGSNNSRSAASPIEVGTQYRGQIAENDDCDYFEVQLPAPGRITLTAKTYLATSFSLCGANGTELGSFNTKRPSSYPYSEGGWSLDVAGGTYYLRVSASNSGGAGNYSFSISLEDAGESFADAQGGSNNSPLTASAIELGVAYSGQLAANDDKDCYSFTTADSGKVLITAVSAISKTQYEVLDRYGDPVASTSAKLNAKAGEQRLSWEVDCGQGGFYLVVTRPSKDATGPYDFRVDELVDIGKTTVTCADATYTGKECKPDVAVEYGGRELVLFQDYTVSFSNNVNAGSGAKATVTGMGGFTGTKTAYFAINKAEQPLKVSGKTAKVLDDDVANGKVKIPVASACGVSGNKGKVTFEKVKASKLDGNFMVKPNGTVIVKAGTPIGTYKLKVRAKAAGDSNYEPGAKGFTCTVQVYYIDRPARGVLKKATRDPVRDIRYLDSTGTKAVAITATGTYTNGGPRYRNGRVWLVSNGKAKQLYSSQSMVASEESVKLYSVEGGKMYVVEGEAGVVDSRSQAWFIKGGSATQLPSVGGNLTMTGKNEFQAFQSAYEGYHTKKHYYYYWDGKKLVEYGGKAITQEQLRRAGNGDKILGEIGGLGSVGAIYYRSNGIINVNYSSRSGSWVMYGNVTLRYKSGKVEYAQVKTFGQTALERATDGGTYQKRNPDNEGRVAVSYPKEFPATGR